MTIHWLVGILALAAAAAPATAGEPAAPAAGAAAPAEKLICKRIADTGTLARKRRQCLTAKEWERIAEEARVNARHVQDTMRGGYTCQATDQATGGHC